MTTDGMGPSVRAGDRRLAEFWSPGAWRLVATVGILLLCVVGLGKLATAIAESIALGAAPDRHDFRVFWGAARLALEGTPLAAFDGERLAGVAGADPDHYLPWLYPPGFLLLVTPLGWLPFAAAWAAFTALSLAAVLLAVRPYAGDSFPAWIAFGLAPAFVPTVILGQNNLLWLACLLAALTALRSGRAVLAGVLIGLLTLKPQLGLLIPVALLACGAWRSILAASVVAVLLALGPTLLYGAAYWGEMLDAGHMQAEKMLGRADVIEAFISPYGLLAGAGLPLGIAMALQWLVTFAAGMLVWRTWRDRRASFDLRAGVLMAAIPLSTPYLLYYDVAFLPLAALLLLRAGAFRPRPLDRLVLGLLWLGVTPVIMAWVYLVVAASPRLWAMPLILLLATVAARAALRPQGFPAAPSDRAAPA